MENYEIDKWNILINLMRIWEGKATLAREAHYKSANDYDKLHYWFGMPVIALTTLVGTGAFASLQESADNRFRFLAGIFSVAAAILAALQTFFNYQGLAEKHRLTANKYSALIRELEMRREIHLEYAAMVEFIDAWRQKYDGVQESSPSVPERIWRKTIKPTNVDIEKHNEESAQEPVSETKMPE